MPTRSRVSFVHRVPHYSPRLVLSLGIVQLVCGIALVFLSLVMFRFDREKALSWSISFYYLEGILPDLFRIIWLGIWVVTSGLITVIVSFRPYSSLQIYGLLLSSLLTLAITGVFAILISNHVIQHSILASMLTKNQLKTERFEIHMKQNTFPNEEAHLSRPNPALFFNVFMLGFCTVAFVISIVSFSVVSQHLCSCSAIQFDRTSLDYHIYDTTWSKKDRIVRWVMQQSQLSDHSIEQLKNSGGNGCGGNRTELFLCDDADLQLNCVKLNAFHSSTTNSTKLSLYKS